MTTHLAGLEVAREAALIAGLPLDRIILIGDADPKARVKHFSSLRSTTKACGEGVDKRERGPSVSGIFVWDNRAT